MKRREFVTKLTITAAAIAGVKPVADAFIKFASLPEVWGDGLHDDTAGLQAMLDGRPYLFRGVYHAARPDSDMIFLPEGTFRVTGLRVTGRTALPKAVRIFGTGVNETIIKLSA
jgi:hypothetical protein